MSSRPSFVWALGEIPGLWRLVIACWVVLVLCWLPAVWVLGGAVVGPLGNLPDGEVPQGEVLLILIENLAGMTGPMKLAVLSGCVVLWIWTVLWHGGLVGWRLWSGGRRVRLGEVLGLGMVAWWRYARLSLTAVVALAALLAVLWLPLSRAVTSSFEAMAEGRMLLLIVTGIGVSDLLALVVWAATIRAAWLLGLPERRSVVLAWLRGLLDTVRTPLASLGTVILWALPALLITLVPFVAGGYFESLRGGWLLPALGQIAAIVRAVCWLGMFLSFAPITGLMDEDTGDRSR
jgi:hypothetical protein